MSYLCQVCGVACDDIGVAIPASVEVTQPAQPVTCIACRLEAIRVKKYGPKTIPKVRETYQQLPYKD